MPSQIHPRRPWLPAWWPRAPAGRDRSGRGESRRCASANDYPLRAIFSPVIVVVENDRGGAAGISSSTDSRVEGGRKLLRRIPRESESDFSARAYSHLPLSSRGSLQSMRSGMLLPDLLRMDLHGPGDMARAGASPRPSATAERVQSGERAFAGRLLSG